MTTRTLTGTPGNRVRQAREAAGLTQDEVAAIAPIDRSALSNIERGKRGLGADVAERLARVLGVRLEDLLPPPAEVPTVDQLHRRLLALEAQVASLPTREDLERGLAALQAAIAAQASQGTRQASEGAKP